MDENKKQEEVTIKTSDEQIIKGTYYYCPTSKKGLLLLHQLAKDRNSWHPWISEFTKTHNVLAIDLRGHGKSTGDYKDFSDDDFNSIKKDVAASFEFFESKGIVKKEISLIGASIGANTVQNYSSVNVHDKSVLLSPGTNYRGIKLTLRDTSSLVVASKEDSYSYDSCKELEALSPNSKFIFLQNKGHGTNMLDSELVLQILTFINK
jgi:hypothetical protein